MGKREREEVEVEGVQEAIDSLQATLERGGAELKLRALDKIIALVDPSDDLYVVQKALVNNDASFYITELLSDPSAASRAAEAVSVLCRHSAPALARMAAGGMDSTVERINFNPCQSDFVDSGAVAALAPMLVARQEAAREAAADGVAALCSYNQEGKLAYLEALVQLLLRGAQAETLPQLLELLDAAADGMECSSEAAQQQLDLLPPPLLSELRFQGRPASQPALGLLATLCEKHSTAAEELRRGGAVGMVAQHLLHGPQPAQDVAARALWLLSRGDRQCLSAAGGQLGCDAVQLAQVLIQLLEVAEAQEAARESSDGEVEGEEGEGGRRQGGFGALAAAAAAHAAEAEVCHAEEASQLLRALAAQHPAVEQLVDEREIPVVRQNAQCCIC